MQADEDNSGNSMDKTEGNCVPNSPQMNGHIIDTLDPCNSQDVELMEDEEKLQTTQELIDNVFEQPLQDVPTTPDSYLEYLHVIINCSKILNQPDMSEETVNSVTDLLHQAQKLFLENACNLLIQTVKIFDSDESQPPKFWFSTFSIHECRIWIELMDSLIFFWSQSEYSKSQATIVMSHTSALVTEIETLRSIYFPKDAIANGEPTEGKDQALTDISKLVKDSFKISFLSGLINFKKPPKDFLLYEVPKIQSILELGELRKSTKLLSWSEITTLLKHVTFQNLEVAFNLDKNKTKGEDWMFFDRIRNFYLGRKAFRIRKRETIKTLDPSLFEFLDAWVVYLNDCVQQEKLWQNRKVQNGIELRNFLHASLKRVVINRLETFKVSGSWVQLPKTARQSWEELAVTKLSLSSTSVQLEPACNGAVLPPDDECRHDKLPNAIKFQITLIRSSQLFTPQLFEMPS